MQDPKATEEALRELESIRSGERGPGPHRLDLRGRRLPGVDLSGLDLSGSDLSGCELSRADLKGAVLLRANLRDACLFEADASEAELAGADLRGTNLQGLRAHSAGLGRASLDGANLARADLKGATLSDASLRGADLTLACLSGGRALQADFGGADLSRSDLRELDLTGSRFERATLQAADLRGARLRGIRGYQRASWIHADVREVDFNHAHLCRRFILDQNYIEEFRTQSRASAVLYRLWWLTSDCGRSLVRWGLLTLTIAVAFAGLYTQVEVDYGDYRTPLSPFYYSVVTLTTLGYGDSLPASTAAQVVCMAEVVLGYVMLGGLLSIFSNKMARRSE
ncbi:MAG: pentapeptide repeat-containing protein [Planctomycetota bacterium]